MPMITVDMVQGLRKQGALIAHFVTEDGGAWGLHWTPEQSDISGIGWVFAEIGRQGRAPLVRRDSQQARTLTFTHPITDQVVDQSCTEVVRIMMGLADAGVKVRLINVTDDIETRGWWWPSLSVKIVERDTEQQIKRADLTWTLKQANEERPLIARVTPPPPPPPPPSVASPPPAMQSDYTVKKGDSLWSLASRFLGSGPRWPEIFDANVKEYNIPPAEMYRGLLTVWIQIGWVLKIPAR